VNELNKEEFDQLVMRTNEKIIMAQNPSDALHFSLTYQNHPECTYIHSTYKDNPFLSRGIINQIESYKNTDEDMWNVYGLGLPAKNNELVYTHAQFYNDEELYVKDADGKDIPIYNEIIYGLDFGFNHPTALVKVYMCDEAIYCEEIIHESYLTTSDLIQKMKSLNIPTDKKIYCDSAEPKTIEEIKRAGFDAVLSLKEVKEGIDCIKSFKFYINNNSTKLISELRKYKWKMKNGQKTDEPIRLFDDGLCAIRYAVYTYTQKTKRSNDYDFDVEIIDL
jgi:phage terminase large subunit